MDSILSSVKQMLGIPADDTFFDQTLMLHINSVFSIIRQLGVGPSDGYVATASNTWSDFFGEWDDRKLQLIKTYMGMKVRQLFDPPTNSTVANALERQIAELEWRLNIQVDPTMVEDDEKITIYIEDLDDNEF